MNLSSYFCVYKWYNRNFPIQTKREILTRVPSIGFGGERDAKGKNQSTWVSLNWRSKSVAAFSTKTPETATAHRRSRMKFTEKATSLCSLLAVVKQKSSWLPSVFFDILPSSSYSKKPNENLDLISRVSWPYHAKQMSSKEFCREKGLITKKSCKICFNNINVLSLVILYINLVL